MDDIIITSAVTLPADAIDVKFSRSGGKGGQNVNKVSTKVELVVDLSSVRANDRIRALIFSRLRHRLDAEGKLHVVSQESRSQWQNRRNAMEKLTAMLRDAMVEEKRRKATKPTRSSQHARVEQKKQHSVRKQQRRKTIGAED